MEESKFKKLMGILFLLQKNEVGLGRRKPSWQKVCQKNYSVNSLRNDGLHYYDFSRDCDKSRKIGGGDVIGPESLRHQSNNAEQFPDPYRE